MNKTTMIGLGGPKGIKERREAKDKMPPGDLALLDGFTIVFAEFCSFHRVICDFLPLLKGRLFGFAAFQGEAQHLQVRHSRIHALNNFLKKTLGELLDLQACSRLNQ